MRCPFCRSEETQVKDSRPAEDLTTIRRRRSCTDCGARFTTFERVQIRTLMIVKNNGKLQSYDREKLLTSMRIALRKRPIDNERIELLVNAITRQLESSGENEISSEKVGALAMNALAKLDPVAYVRFASVYRNFYQVKDFADFISEAVDTNFDILSSPIDE